MASTSAKLLYRPVGLGSSLLAGAVAGALFKRIWKAVAKEDDPPTALQSEYGIGHLLLAAAVQGAIFGVVKAAIDRSGAEGFRKLTGEWPGD
jgi:hypothetical protein